MSKRNFLFLLGGTFLVYLLNLRLDVMAVDASQYAEMSWEMLSTKSFLQVHCLGNDYLDKPPLLFWLNSLSFYVFGISNFSYKLPSLLFALLGIYSTYRFAKLYYGDEIARAAALILASTQALFLITNDVRTDTMLMGAVIFATWQWSAFFESAKTKNLLLGAVGIGLALLAKGPVGLIATGAALFPQVIWKKKLKQLLDFRILVAIAIIALMLLPMCIGLYQQYGSKGLEFYFWKQSFGRITGQSEWNNHPDPFFLVHSSAWALIPWTLFFFVGWIKKLITLFKNKFSQSSAKEIASVSGFTLVLIALSLSKYQLPHYIFVVFPLAAVISAEFVDELQRASRAKKTIAVVQVIATLLLLGIALFIQYCFKVELGILSLISCVVCFCIVFGGAWVSKSVLVLTATAGIAFNFLLSMFYYPAILSYQPEAAFGRYMKEHGHGNVAYYHYIPDYTFVFYAQQKPDYVLWDKEHFNSALNEKKELLVFAGPFGMKDIIDAGLRYEKIDEHKAFAISHLNWTFLNPTTRNNSCETVYLLRVQL